MGHAVRTNESESSDHMSWNGADVAAEEGGLKASNAAELCRVRYSAKKYPPSGTKSEAGQHSAKLNRRRTCRHYDALATVDYVLPAKTSGVRMRSLF